MTEVRYAVIGGPPGHRTFTPINEPAEDTTERGTRWARCECEWEGPLADLAVHVRRMRAVYGDDTDIE